MNVPQNQNYNIFTALIDNIQKKDRKKLRFAKCQNCRRLVPFRLISVTGSNLKCKKCGNNIRLNTE